VKLADFNISKIVKNNMTKTRIGTPFYASPEIWNSNPYNYKADMWSLGCILYEMCCLKTPFQGKDIKQICRRACRGVYQRIPNVYSKEI
jgi:NIMA (never in mitosis gene a)-related kinase 1/4/5